MKNYLVPLSALALFASVGIANAEEASGKVASVNTEERIIVLEDGTKFIAGEDVSLEALQPGTEVTVSYEMSGDDKIAEEVESK